MKINRNARLFITATGVSRFGSVILTIFFNYWIVSQGKSATFLGTITSIMYVPNVILSFISSSLSESFSKKKLLVFFDISSFFVSIFCFSFLFLLPNSLNDLIIVSIIMIMLNSFAALYGPTSRSLVPLMVPKEDISRFNTLYTIFSDCIKFIAPLILSIPFILKLQMSDFFLLNAVTFILSIIFTVRITGDFKMSSINNKRKLFPIKEVLQHYVAKRMIELFFIVNLILSSFGIVLPLICKDTIGMNHYPTLVMCQSLSSLMFSGLLLLVKKNKVSFEKILGCSLILGLVLVILSIWTIPTIVYLTCILLGSFTAYFSISFFSIVQSNDDINKISGIYGLISAISVLAIPIGSLISGFLYDIIGVYSLVFFGSCTIIFFFFRRKQS